MSKSQGGDKIYSLVYAKAQLPTNSVSKVWADLRSDRWTEYFVKCSLHMSDLVSAHTVDTEFMEG